MAPVKRIIITTGDVDGIGWEVTAKSLNSIGLKRNVQFIVWRGEPQKKFKLHSKLKPKTFLSLDAALQENASGKNLFLIESADSPAKWVELSAQVCFERKAHALVTAPLSKTSIVDSGLSDIGHTEILARVSGAKDLFMGFIGKNFSVLLMSGHLPLKQALEAITPELFRNSVAAAEQLRSVIARNKRNLPIALIGLNPHAGETGLIGHEEVMWHKWLKDLNRKNLKIEGPLVPDAAFLQKNWARYSVYVCPYHDQGLIPFKLVHGFNEGVHLTLGLPFVRTSVDHGTAKDIYGLGKARAGSMRDAILTAIQLVEV